MLTPDVKNKPTLRALERSLWWSRWMLNWPRLRLVLRVQFLFDFGWFSYGTHILGCFLFQSLGLHFRFLSFSVGSHVSLKLCSELEKQAALRAWNGIFGFVMKILVSGKVWRSVEAFLALIASEHSSILVMCQMILELRRSWKLKISWMKESKAAGCCKPTGECFLAQRTMLQWALHMLSSKMSLIFVSLNQISANFANNTFSSRIHDCRVKFIWRWIVIYSTDWQCAVSTN